MTRSSRRTAGVVAALLACVLAAAVPAGAQPPPTSPFEPAWGMLAGWDVFAKKGCGQCHALRGLGPTIGPDLARIKSGTSFFDVGAAMWNHLPRMGAEMRAQRIARPALSASEVADLIAFVFTAQYSDELGDAGSGERVFAAKGCARCHTVGGAGGRGGPALDGMKRANSPVLVAAAMWNHGPAMAEAMKARGIARPTFEGREMLDLVAYVVAAAKESGEPTAQVVPGTPARGERRFAEHGCATCHAVGGKGGGVGPDLGRAGHHVSLTRFAALMWNHGPAMWAKMKERGLEVPQLEGQEMADILAYLYTAHYFDPRARPARGQRLVRERACATCHAIRGQGGTEAADLAASNAARSPASLIAAMWNHAGFMEAKARDKRVVWPVLTGQELADISAFLASLARRAPRKSN